MKNDIYERFTYIETRLWWGDGVTASELAKTFGLARQTAQGVIDLYRRQHPGTLIYDESRRRQIATPDFKPTYIRPKPAAFLDYLRGQAMTAYYMEEKDWTDLPFEDVDHLLRPALSREPIEVLLSALRHQRAVTINYFSKRRARLRDISPHRLIFAGNRYHVRGYCHVTNDFFDFVLSRIDHAETSLTEWVADQDDEKWHRFVDLCFKPNEKLPPETYRALVYDYPLDDQNIYKVPCREALVLYVERELIATNPKYGYSLWVRVK